MSAYTLPEEILVSRMKAGETQAYKVFFWEYCEFVNTLTHTLLPKGEDAQTVTYAIMGEVWTRRNRSEFKAPLRSFLYREVYRKCQPFLEQKKPRSLVDRLFWR
jgi:hypothetical protein